MLIIRRRIALGSQRLAGGPAMVSIWKKARMSRARATIRHQIRF